MQGARFMLSTKGITLLSVGARAESQRLVTTIMKYRSHAYGTYSCRMLGLAPFRRFATLVLTPMALPSGNDSDPSRDHPSNFDSSPRQEKIAGQ